LIMDGVLHSLPRKPMKILGMWCGDCGVAMSQNVVQ
jgi:hypothetical protein